ncbi:Protein inturned, partial [Dissostichus eleginoides]
IFIAYVCQRVSARPQIRGSSSPLQCQASSLSQSGGLVVRRGMMNQPEITRGQTMREQGESARDHTGSNHENKVNQPEITRGQTMREQ